MLCQSRPYEGNEPFLFFSYCRKNAPEVYPIIEQMDKDGYRIWYDDGIDPGEDWMEVIADHLNRSAAVVAFITPEMANSHNCRNEINFAMEFQKPLLSVILEKFTMPLAMRLQLGATQYLPRYEYNVHAVFYEKLYSAACLQQCRSAHRQANKWEIRAFEDEQRRAQEEKQAAALREQQTRAATALRMAETAGRITEPDQTPVQPSPQPEPSAQDPRSGQNIPPEAPACTPVKQDIPVKTLENETPRQSTPPDVTEKSQVRQDSPAEESAERENLSARVAEKASVRQDTSDEAPWNKPPQPPEVPVSQTAVLIHQQSGRIYPLQLRSTRIGRIQADCQIAFPDNKKMSRRHAEVLFEDGRWMLIDQNSLNHSFLNGELLEPGAHRELHCLDLVSAAHETFRFLSGPSARELLDTGVTAWLRLAGGQEQLWLPPSGIILGRMRGPVEGLRHDPKISREHAELRRYGTEYVLRDLGAANGTFVNDHRLGQNQECCLRNGDKLRLGASVLEFMEISLKEREVV